jgi:integrase
MASIERRTRNGHTFYLARWRDPSGKQVTKSFDRRKDAESYMHDSESAKNHGSYVNPAKAKITTGEWSRRWLAGQSQLKPSTRARYAGIVSKHVLPRWEHVQLAEVEHVDVQEWISAIDLAPASVHYIHRVFSLIMQLAIRDRSITHNPADHVKLPKATDSEKRFLSKAEVFRLADACKSVTETYGKDYRTLILTLAYTGLRWGELAALRVGRVDLMRGRLVVAEAVSEVAGRLVWGTPKSHQRRSVPIPRFLCDLLAVELAGKAADDLVFTTLTGKPLRNLNFRRDVFDQAATDAGLSGLTPHELRHTAASLAVSAGANVKAVQRMLGHKSAVMTLDVYAGLFDDDLDALAARMDVSDADVEQMWNSADVITLPTARNPL